MRACQNPSPVIDGRRANCNLASLGAQKTRPPTPQHGLPSFSFLFSFFIFFLFYFFVEKMTYRQLMDTSNINFLAKVNDH